MWAFDETVDVALDIQIALELRTELHHTVKAAEKVACVGRGSDSFMGMPRCKTCARRRRTVCGYGFLGQG